MSVSSLACPYLSMHSHQPWFVLQAAKEFSVSISDSPLISHFYSFETKLSSAFMLSVPDGCIDIIFDCDDTNPSVSVHGTMLQAGSVEFCKGRRYVGVRFSPGFVPDYLNLSAEELIEGSFDLLDVSFNAERVFEQVVREKNFVKQLTFLKQFFLTNTAPRKSLKLTLPVVNMICQAQGNVCIKNLESLTGYTIRTLQRSFHNDLGMTPKMFCRIIRCQSAIYKIHHNDIGFSDLAFDLGFSDQPHFLREFKHLVSVTPLDYKNRILKENFVSRMHFY